MATHRQSRQGFDVRSTRARKARSAAAGTQRSGTQTSCKQRQATAFGKYAGMLSSSDEFAAEKRRELEAESRR